VFILRDEHLAAFRQSGIDRFNRAAVGYLRRRHPDVAAGLSDAGLLTRCRAWNPEARQRGYVTDRHGVRYYSARLFLELAGRPDPGPDAAGDPEAASAAFEARAKAIWQAVRPAGGGR